ncbi:ATP-dependent nuclease [Pseudoteredinibacter isoporae]|uniref:ATP-dependent nuclease n=1 Tax=Pseudoteredinibacter isoporae TaxID=570281 RepID=UPI003105A6E2
MIPLKSAYLDSSNGRFVNGSDAYVSRVIGDYLSDSEKVDVAQAYREMRVSFGEDDSVKAINKAIGKSNFVEGKNISISVAAPSQSSWESSLTAYLDGVPFNFIGQGEQSIIKVSLAMSEKKTKNANVALIEEPENHLSHSKLNELLLKVDSGLEGKQVFITTHSSFVANKLGLDNLILLGGEGVTTFSDLSPDTQEFFRKLPGYDVLRMILCKSVVLVEGDCDELIFQKAYMDRNDGRLPIEDGIEVISVGTSFLRFLEISEKIKIPTIVITDNDGDVEALRKKYKCYLGNDKKDNIEVFYQDAVVDYSGSLESYNNNTLEPEMLRANGIDIMNLVLDSKTKYDKDDDILSYMKNNKTKCALRVFDYNGPISYPDYINKAVAYYD